MCVLSSPPYVKQVTVEFIHEKYVVFVVGIFVEVLVDDAIDCTFDEAVWVSWECQ